MFRIMIIDDEPLVLEQLEMIMSNYDDKVLIVGRYSSGIEAIENYKKCNPDIVITDISMAEMNGLEAINKMQEMFVYKPVFIVLSGYNKFDYAKTALKLGVSSYLLKPIFEDELNDALEKAYREVEIEKRKYYETIILENEGFHELIDEHNLRQSYLYSFYSKSIKVTSKCVSSMGIDQLLNDILYDIRNMNERNIQKQINLFKDIGIYHQWHPDYVKGVIWKFIQYNNLNHEVFSEAIEKKYFDRLNASTCTINVVVNIMMELYKKLMLWILECKDEKFNYPAVYIKLYIEENYSKNITVLWFANELHINKAYLGQLFIKAYGVSVNTYLNQRRIESAKDLMLNEEYISLKEIAEKTGYQNYISFLKQFASLEGMSPTEYRSKILPG